MITISVCHINMTLFVNTEILEKKNMTAVSNG